MRGFGSPKGVPSLNKKVAGCGRLRRPSSQPALLQKGLGNSISVVSVAEPGNRQVEAGSATSEALSETGCHSYDPSPRQGETRRSPA